MNSALLLAVVIGLFTCRHVAGSQVHHIRGVPISKTSLYPADRDFQCLDGSLFIPFNRVNDDYCDCADGSDEPATSACSNGSFFCHNPGHRPQYIPSSWVNDGVCDCCDASDEYASGKSCVDNCHELGKEARIEAQRLAELAKEGNKIRLEMMNRGKQIKTEQQSQIVKLRADYEEAERIKKEKEVIKNQAEEREKIALEKYKPAEAERVINDPEEDEISANEAEDYFNHLDSDSSGTVTVAELQVRQTFDVNRNGEVSLDEAKYFLNNKEEVTLQEFLDSAWANVKPYVMLEEGTFKQPNQEETETGEHDDPERSKEEEEEHEAEGEENAEDAEIESEPPAPQYDEETQILISEADKGRSHFKDAENSVRDLLAELRKLEDQIDRDYGPEQEFAPLDGQCFDYTDLEYVYTFCPFGKATQKSKSGGSEVILGHWHEWVEFKGNRYSAMKFDRGLACWNGPTRSTTVHLSCGTENKILAVTEPSRCEYAMEFSTPAVCYVDGIGDTHDEL
ncbi:glucosidase 2 subunit beta [Diprion similis]|uniref:glucosidase 2 subunit beta n=1 Tax=Diprion similis TaxID=362088 RepID=UPI001EF8D300|nr:glucosidase 2 subunit beta [Diprion similis]